MVQEFLVGEEMSAVPRVREAAVGSQLPGQHRVETDCICPAAMYCWKVALPKSLPVSDLRASRLETIPKPIPEGWRISVGSIQRRRRVANPFKDNGKGLVNIASHDRESGKL